jgi:gluconokinase
VRLAGTLNDAPNVTSASLTYSNSAGHRFVTVLPGVPARRRDDAPRRLRGVIVIVAGVAGSGKTTVGTLLAGRLGWVFADADTFHPRANVERMRRGEPLTDEDRRPWLRAITAWMDERLTAGQSGVITCSALKRSYRAVLLDGRPAATMVLLDVDPDVLRRRVAAREEHFFPRQLLESQLAALEQPSAAEEPRVRVIAGDGDAQEMAAKIIAVLWPSGAPGGEPGGAAS